MGCEAGKSTGVLAVLGKGRLCETSFAGLELWKGMWGRRSRLSECKVVFRAERGSFRVVWKIEAGIGVLQE